MASRTGFKRAVFFDSVHVLMVDYSKREAKLYENAGSAPGELLIREANATETASVTNPYELVDMAFRYAISFALLAKVLDREVVKVFEVIGVKDFLDRVEAATTEEMRRDRFHGFAMKFIQPESIPASGNGATEPVATVAEAQDDEEDYDDEDDYGEYGDYEDESEVEAMEGEQA